MKLIALNSVIYKDADGRLRSAAKGDAFEVDAKAGKDLIERKGAVEATEAEPKSEPKSEPKRSSKKSAEASADKPADAE